MTAPLNHQAVVAANDALYAAHPELKGRPLTMEPEDLAYRQQWMRSYKAALAKNAGPPPPKVLPTPAQIPPPPAGPVSQCPMVATMTHKEKMVAAIKSAKLSDAERLAIGDVEQFAEGLLVAVGVLALAAATGIGGAVELASAGLLAVGAFFAGYNIGAGIAGLVSFYNATRCDTAKWPSDLTDAGQVFASAVNDIGVGAISALMVAAGVRARGTSATDIPSGLQDTLDRINRGEKFPHRNDGSIFQNREGNLPSQPPGYYTEYVHPTAGVNGPGAQRIVVGQGGETYYTPDHYKTFIRIK